jgi:hypothetical protein
VPPLSGQALIALVGSEDRGRALLAWERSSSRAAREIELCVLDPSGSPEAARARMAFSSETDTPHFVADQQGFATLTLGPMVLKDDGGERAAPSGPIYVRFGADLAVRAAEPVRVEPLAHEPTVMAGVPAAVHGLECQIGLCSALASGSGEPALLVLVTLPVRPSPWRAPASRRPPPSPPMAEALTTMVLSDDAIAEVAAARLADGRTLLAWVTLPKQSGDGQADPRSPSPPNAELAFRFLGVDGTPGPVQVLSQRAIAVGGVDVVALPAPKGKRDGVAVIAWSGPHAGAAQVFLSKIGADGSKVEQKTITQVARPQKSEIPSEVYDVDAEPDGHGGLLCAWADTRDGSSEIYLARANALLSRIKTEKRITHAKGAATEPRLSVSGERVWLAWSEAPEGGAAADIRLALVALGSLEPIGGVRRASESTGHSRTPSFAGVGEALTLSWLDEPSEGHEGGVSLVALDDSGAPLGPAREVRLRGGAQPSSATLRCDAARCRGVLAATTPDGLGLGAFEVGRLSGALASEAKIVATVAGQSVQDVGLAAGDDLVTVFFVDVLGNGGRVRRLTLRW